jgi:hypothetical protein
MKNQSLQIRNNCYALYHNDYIQLNGYFIDKFHNVFWIAQNMHIHEM